MMARLVRRGPSDPTLEPGPVESGRPRGPVSALPEAERQP
jgi:hypothetical protein